MIGRGGKQEGIGREEREKKGGAACLTIKKSSPRPWPVSINFTALIKRYRRHGP